MQTLFLVSERYDLYVVRSARTAWRCVEIRQGCAAEEHHIIYVVELCSLLFLHLCLITGRRPQCDVVLITN